MNTFWSAVVPLLSQAWSLFLSLYPIWLPLALISVFWDLWVHYVRTRLFSETKYALLEIRIPREIRKSPRAMEVVFNSLYNTADEGTFWFRYWKGQVRPWFSFEIVSDFGQIRFFIWAQEKHKNYIESQIYAQYPEVEIHQVEDYTTAFSFDPDVNNLYGTHFEKAGPNTLPTVTYEDYGLDQVMLKEEQKIDPLSQLLELMSIIKPGEHIWLQIGIQAHKKERHGGVFTEATDWRKEIAKTRQKLFENMKKEGRSAPAKVEQSLLDALGRAYQKYPFNCSIRAIYWADEAQKFRGPMIGTVVTLMRPFSHSASVFSGSFDKDSFAGFNGFKPADGTGFNYPWQDFRKINSNRRKKEIVDSYKHRGFFYNPYKRKTFILTSEELATIYHFPGSTVAAPNLGRIPSKQSQPPSNLPV